MEPNRIPVICLEQPAFRRLLDETINYIKVKFDLPNENPWLSSEQTMNRLNITSRATLQKIRDSGELRFSKTSAKNILYDRKSVDDYIERQAQKQIQPWMNKK